MDPVNALIIVVAGIATTMGIVINGLSYWYWTRRPLTNVILFSLSLLGIGAAIGIINSLLGESTVIALLGLAASIYSWHYLLTKAKPFRTSESWIKILLTSTIVNLILGMILIGWTLDVLNAGTIAQAIIPIGG